MSKQKQINVKLERRNIFVTIIMIVLGICMFVFGIAGAIASIPFMLIVIGIFTFVGFGTFGLLGLTLVINSIYKNIETTCPYCKDEVSQFGSQLKTKGSYKCKRCNNVVLVKLK